MKLSVLARGTLRAVLDCLFCLLSWKIAVWVFSYFSFSESAYASVIKSSIWIIVLFCVLFHAVCGVYKSLWQHHGFGYVVRLAVAAFLTTAAVYFVLYLQIGHLPNPGIFILAGYLFLSASFLVRVYKKLFQTIKEYFARVSTNGAADDLREPIRTLLVGAGESASGFLLHKNQQGARPREILGIVDANYRKHGYSLHGVRILGDDSKIPELVRRLNIDEIVVAVPSMSNEELRRIVKLTPIKRCKVRMMSVLSTDKTSDALRDINIRDLLGRSEGKLDFELVDKWVAGKTVMITGGGGSIGGEICRQLMGFNVGKIVLYDIYENGVHNLRNELFAGGSRDVHEKIAVRIGSVQDKNRLDEVFAETKPDIVFHAAAYKHVPLMEECPRIAFENNVIGTFNTAHAAGRHGVTRFVMISTDKAVNPTSIMGATKRISEILVMGMNGWAYNTGYVCVRFGNVLDSNGSVIPTFKGQIANGGPVTITHPDIIRYFMTMPEAAQLVLEAGAMTQGGEIFILNMGEPVKIMDLAENLIRMAGLTPGVDIDIEITGLRPGEKLYEELLLATEGLVQTPNDKIFFVKPPQPECFEELVHIIDEYSINKIDVRDLLKRFIPEYQTPNK